MKKEAYSIVPLSAANFKEALAVALEIFALDPKAKDWIPMAYEKSLYPHLCTREASKFSYWVLVENATHAIVGVTGLYVKDEDKHYCYWLGWFGVLSRYRRKGFGRRLFDWTVAELKRRRKSTLKVQTTDLRYATDARRFYAHEGFVEIGRKAEEAPKASPYHTLYLQKHFAGVVTDFPRGFSLGFFCCHIGNLIISYSAKAG